MRLETLNIDDQKWIHESVWSDSDKNLFLGVFREWVAKGFSPPSFRRSKPHFAYSLGGRWIFRDAGDQPTMAATLFIQEKVYKRAWLQLASLTEENKITSLSPGIHSLISAIFLCWEPDLLDLAGLAGPPCLIEDQKPSQRTVASMQRVRAAEFLEDIVGLEVPELVPLEMQRLDAETWWENPLAQEDKKDLKYLEVRRRNLLRQNRETCCEQRARPGILGRLFGLYRRKST